MQLSTAWNFFVDSGATRALLYLQLTILLASIWLFNQVSALLYDRQIRVLGIPDGEPSEPKIRARQPEQLPYDFSPQGTAFDDDNIPSEVLLSGYGQTSLKEGTYQLSFCVIQTELANLPNLPNLSAKLKNKLWLLNGPTSVILPLTLTALSVHSCLYCASLRHLTGGSCYPFVKKVNVHCSSILVMTNTCTIPA